jgi:hypothetical protein
MCHTNISLSARLSGQPRQPKCLVALACRARPAQTFPFTYLVCRGSHRDISHIVSFCHLTRIRGTNYRWLSFMQFIDFFFSLPECVQLLILPEKIRVYRVERVEIMRVKRDIRVPTTFLQVSFNIFNQLNLFHRYINCNGNIPFSWQI